MFSSPVGHWHGAEAGKPDNISLSLLLTVLCQSGNSMLLFTWKPLEVVQCLGSVKGTYFYEESGSLDFQLKPASFRTHANSVLKEHSAINSSPPLCPHKGLVALSRSSHLPPPHASFGFFLSPLKKMFSFKSSKQFWVCCWGMAGEDFVASLCTVDLFTAVSGLWPSALTAPEFLFRTEFDKQQDQLIPFDLFLLCVSLLGKASL